MSDAASKAAMAAAMAAIQRTFNTQLWTFYAFGKHILCLDCAAIEVRERMCKILLHIGYKMANSRLRLQWHILTE